MFRIVAGLLAIWCWFVIIAFMAMYFTTPPEYGDSSGYLAMSLFVLYFAVFMTPFAIFGEDEIRKNDMDLALLFWPIILILIIVSSPFVIYMIWRHEEA